MKKYLFKKCTSLVLVLFLLLSIGTPVYAKDNSIKVQLNGENISFDVAPKMVNNRIMVPMKAVFEKLGANVEWDGQTRSITATKDETVIKLKLDSRDAVITKNGAETKLRMDIAPLAFDGRTLVPIRFISESLGKQVGWDDANRTVVIIDYNYFLDAFKTQAPNFYEFATNQYGTIDSGESNGSADVSFKYESTEDPSENVSGNVNATINAKLNKENGSMDALIKVNGLQDALEGSGLEKFDNFSFNIFFDNNSFYVKSNLFSLLEQYGVEVGDKWIKADIADLEIPNVKTLQDLKEMQRQQPSQKIVDQLNDIPVDLDVNSFAEAQTLFSAVATLVDNNHFTLNNNGDTKNYSWNIQKQDLVDLVLNIEKNSGSYKDLTLQDLAEMKKFTDSLVFDFKMEVGVKDSIIVSSKVSFNTKMDIPDTGHFEMTLKSSSEILNPNSAVFTITMPSPDNVINYKDLQPGEML